MQLLTKELREIIPPLYSQEKEEDPFVYARFFAHDTEWEWLITEHDGQDICFGVAIGFELEWGYFSLRELESLERVTGIEIERDEYFEPCYMSDITIGLTRTA